MQLLKIFIAFFQKIRSLVYFNCNTCIPKKTKNAHIFENSTRPPSVDNTKELFKLFFTKAYQVFLHTIFSLVTTFVHMTVLY